jgi:hypothetical protein
MALLSKKKLSFNQRILGKTTLSSSEFEVIRAINGRVGKAKCGNKKIQFNEM